MEWLTACLPDLRAAASRIVPPQEVDDIVQEACMKAIRLGASYQFADDAHRLAFCARLVRNVSIDAQRRALRDKRDVRRNVGGLSDGDFASAAADPSEVASARELAAITKDAIASLPQALGDAIQEALFGHAGDRNRLFRGRRALRRELIARGAI